MSETNNDVRLHKKRQKIEKFFLAQNLTEANNESTFRLQKNTKTEEKKIEKLFLAQNCLNQIMSQLKDNSKKMTKIEKLFLGQNCLKRIMILDYPKKRQKIEKKIEKLFLAQNIRRFAETTH